MISKWALPDAHQKVKFICFSTLVIVTIIAAGWINAASSQGSTPVYSVTISMNERLIYGSQKINVTFSIIGMGNVSSGTAAIQSDAENILVNTYSLQSVIFGGGKNTTIGPIIGPPMNETTKSIWAVLSVSPEGLAEGQQQIINGQFQIDTDGVSLGTHRLKVAFLFQSENGNNGFEDTIEYTMIDVFAAYPFLQYLIPALISIPISLATVLTERWFHRRKDTHPPSAAPRR
jgi:hypothetical protein